MVAITPFAISFLITSIGLFSIFWARSRITMLLGSSMLVLINHLRISNRTSGIHPVTDLPWRWSVSEQLFVHMDLLSGLRLHERVHKSFQTLAVGCGEVDFQGARQAAFQACLPARRAIMQVRAASSQFARGVNQHPIRAAHDAHQLAFSHHGAASDAG